MQLNEYNRREGKGNRLISWEIQQEVQSKMQSSKFLNLYEIAYSNLACKGKTIGKSIRFSSQAEREDYALLMLLYMAIMKKERHIKTDLYQAFEELKIYLEDANAWAEPGTHYLFLSQEDVPYSKGQIKLKNNAL